MINNSTAMIEGNVTQTPVLKTTKTGKSVCHFQVAVNHYSKADVDPMVSYIEVETWEKFADFCSNNISKGEWLMVFGNLKQDRWEGTDGKNQSKIKIIGHDIKFLKSFKDSNKSKMKESA